MFCSNCGQKVPADTKFCPHCGADLQAAKATAQPQKAAVKKTTATPQTGHGRLSGLVNWYHGLQRPWLVWLVALLVVVGVGGGIYHYRSFQVEVGRHNPWYLVNTTQLDGKTATMKLSFNDSGRVTLNDNSDSETFAASLNDSLVDGGSWHGDHKKVVINLNKNVYGQKITLTKMNKVSKTIDGHTYKGYFVQTDFNANGGKSSVNMYLLHR